MKLSFQQSNNTTPIPMNEQCPQCGETASGKFCGKCGAKLPAASVEQTASDPKVSEAGQGYVSWNFQPAEIARKLSIDEILEVATGGAKGFIITEGQRALIYIDGQFVGEVGAGKHNFLTPEDERKLEQAYTARSGGVLGSVSEAGRALTRFFLGDSKKDKEEDLRRDYDKLRSQLGRDHSVNVVITRSAPFLTRHVLKGTRTKDLTADLALTLRVALGNLKAFYSELLLDRQKVTQTDIETYLLGSEETGSGELSEFKDAVRNFTVEELCDSEAVKKQLSAKLQELSPEAVRVLQIVTISADRQELTRIREEHEANVIAERELENLITTNRICNRFQSEANRKAIEDAQGTEDLEAALQKVNADGLLRQEQADALVREIRERSENHDINRSQILRLVQHKNDFDYEKERLTFEEQIVNRQLEIKRQREAQEAAHKLAMERERATFERDEDMADLDVLRKMQSVKDEQRQREHERELQAKQQADNAMLDMVKQFAGMTAEQIMVANPNIRPEQAAAMVEIAKAQKEIAQKDDRVDLMREMQKQQQDLMAQFMGTMSGTMGKVAEAKEAELKRTIQSTDKSEERMMRVVNTAVSAAAKLRDQNKGNKQDQRKSEEDTQTCGSCGNSFSLDMKFCNECGAEAMV